MNKQRLSDTENQVCYLVGQLVVCLLVINSFSVCLSFGLLVCLYVLRLVNHPVTQYETNLIHLVFLVSGFSQKLEEHVEEK